MENLRKIATFKPKLAEIITLNRKSKEGVTSNPKIIILDRKSKESVTSKPLSNQEKHKSLL